MNIKSSNDNYYYGSYINYKAIRDFHLHFNLNDSYLKPAHCILLSFITESFHKHDKLPSIQCGDKRYVLMNTNFILHNLIYLKVGHRQIKNYLQDLRRNQLIQTVIAENRNRYITVHTKLIQLCYKLDWNISSTNYLEKNKPELWKAFISEWKPHFKDTESFQDFIWYFNGTRTIKAYSYNTKYIYNHLLNAVRFWLDKKKHNKYY